MAATVNKIESQPLAIRLLLDCGAVGPALFIAAFLIEGATRPGYDPLRHPVSSLSIGDLGWTQAANFLITGSLFLAFAIGLHFMNRTEIHSNWAPILIGWVGIGLIGAGIFTTDPVYGYPTDQPLALAQFSTHGHLHDLFSILVFFCLPAACFVYRGKFARHGERGWALYCVLTGVLMLVTFVLAGVGFKQTPGLVNFAGVFQRLSISIGWVWIALLALRFLRAPLEGAE